MMPNTTNCFMMGPAPSQGLVLQERHFQHGNTPTVARKASQRKDYTQEIQRVELDSIILTCPETSDTDKMLLGGSVQRRVQSRRRQACGVAVNGAQPDEYFPVCGKCSRPSENHLGCQTCGGPLVCSGRLKEPCHPALARPPIHPPTQGPGYSQFFHSYSPPPAVREPQANGNRACLFSSNPLGGGVASCSAPADKASRSRRQQGTKVPEAADTIVLSSDEEDDEGVGVGSRMDSVSPCPADSAHSSPVPAAGRVETAMKDASDWGDVTSDYFTDINARNALPRKTRMKDPSGNHVPESCSFKRRKVLLVSPVHTCVRNHAVKQESIILDCRSVRLGTLRRMVTKPVTFSHECFYIETEAPKEDVLEKVELRASELTSCEWCCVRKLPTLFLQTSPAECLRLRTQLNMSRDNQGVWYDCKSADPDETHIVLIFEKGLTIQEEVLLEEILKDIGKANKLKEFPTRLPFQEANARLVRYNNKAREKKTVQKTVEKAAPSKDQHCVRPSPPPCPPSPVPQPASDPTTRTSTRPHATTHCCLDDQDEEEDPSDFHTTFTGPVEKIIVYPPSPAKGGIVVTNEDLHCLNTGEFVNDVIIDFYLKYLVLERLRKEDARRIHVFSSFFYKRLNQRERKNGSDSGHLPMQKKKHNRVKTWTRHVDLFQKDFVFVPINESAHWYLAVICFPGLDGPRFEPNPLYQAPGLVPTSCSLAEQRLNGAGWPEAAGYSEHPYPCVPAPHCLRAPCFNPMGGYAEPAMSWDCTREDMVPMGHMDGLHRLGMCENRVNDSYPFPDDQSSCGDTSSEEGILGIDGLDESRNTEWTLRPTICKRPCILIMDSLRGPGRSTVVKTLREYLEVEWEVRKGTHRSFGKEVMRGSSPRVPQQDNFSDCGVYVLQYVESFFENPIPSFHLPMNLMQWFPQQRMRGKREEVKELILLIQSQQQTDPQCQGPFLNTDLGSAANYSTGPWGPWGH
ncbi:sentrin-specific protease 6 [Conger conger]|uniref:sentrin-specific protease 6 n=1 Tax=Conger conger TaxID=82655 RepID=UPI002A5A3C0C|nr:sentrin-specific protease 6 [Conger conger]XP_061073802.1 sentrin-specific protease 6 [Conger conger]